MPEEDSLALDAESADVDNARVIVAVVRLPRIANFDDVEPLAAECGVAVRFVTRAAEVDAADVVIVPGSKSTIADLSWLRARGLAPPSNARRATAGSGSSLRRLPDAGERLEIRTGWRRVAPRAASRSCRVHDVRLAEDLVAGARPCGRDGPLAGAAARARGYEIHAGVRARAARAALTLIERAGAPADVADGAVVGSVTHYVHGLLTSAPVRRAILVAAARRRGVAADPRWGTSGGADRYDRLADLVGPALDLDAIGRLARCPPVAVAS